LILTNSESNTESQRVAMIRRYLYLRWTFPSQNSFDQNVIAVS